MELSLIRGVTRIPLIHQSQMPWRHGPGRANQCCVGAQRRERVSHMVHQFQANSFCRSPNHLDHINAMARASNARRGMPLSKRARRTERSQRLPFVPPENWYEPRETGEGYRILVQSPGDGFRHVVTPDEVPASGWPSCLSGFSSRSKRSSSAR